MKFKDHFSSESSDYARFRPRYGPELFEYLAGLVPDRRLAWDCATGSGQAAIPLGEFFERVIATDASGEQIRSAKANPKIEYRVARAENSGLESASCALVTVAQALHWFDLPAFYAEAKRVLKPGGILAVWAYTFMDVGPAMDDVVNHFYRVIVGPFWPPERLTVERGYRSLPFPFDELDPPEFFLTAEWSVDALLGYLRTWSASKKYCQAQGEDPVALIEAKLRALWPNGQETQPVEWPIALRIGRLPPWK
jgi:SAM-dependent methyltransferase